MNRPHIWLSIDFDYFVFEDSRWGFNHSETELGIGFAWTARLAEHQLRGSDLRQATALIRAQPWPGRFWKTLEGLGYRFDQVRSLVVADSHKWAYFAFDASTGPRPETIRIVHFDAHHDLLYSVPGLEASIAHEDPGCDNWQMMTLLRYPELASLVVFPAWKGMRDWDILTERFPDMETDDGRKDYDVSARVKPVVWPDPRVGLAAGTVDRIFICRSGAWVPPWHDRAFQRFCEEAGRVSGRPVETPFEEAAPPLATRKLDLKAVNDNVLLEMTLLGLIGPKAAL